MNSLFRFLSNGNLPKEWTIGAKLPVARVESFGTVVNNKLYVFGGFLLGLKASSRLDIYDPEKNFWHRGSDLPTPVTHVNAVAEGHRIWFVGGFVGDHPGLTTSQAWCYNTIDDRWTETKPLPAKRAGGALQLIDNNLHYIGGFASDRDTTCGDHWVLSLNDNNDWEKRSPLPDPKGHIASMVLGKKIYIIGGQYRHDTRPKDQASVHAYNVETDNWERLSDLPEPRSHFEASTFTVNEQIVIIGGRNNNNKRINNPYFFSHKEDRIIDDVPHRVWRKINHHWNFDYISPAITVYNPTENIWREYSTLPAHLLAPIANIINNQLVVTGGGKNWVTNPQSRTLLNESLFDLINVNNGDEED